MSVQASFTQLDSGPGSWPRDSRLSVRQLCSRSRRRSTNARTRPSATSGSSRVPRSSASRYSWSRNTSCTTCSLNGKLVPRSWASVVLATAQPWCRPPTSWSAGTNTSSRNTSLNSASPVICTNGRISMPGAVHVDHQVGDAAVLGGIGVGAGQADAPPGHRGVAGPHLLARQRPPLGAVGGHRRRGPGGERRQVAPGVGLAEQLAPDLGGVQDRSATTGSAVPRCRGPATWGRPG